MADHAEMLIRSDVPGIEVLRARFQTYRYARHAHEYAVIGLVESGVQSYAYRGARHVTGATGLFFVNADEAHTGEAGDELGYAYRSLRIEESILPRLFEDRRLHRLRFREPVIYQGELQRRLLALHRAFESGSSALACEALLIGFLEALNAFNAEDAGADRSFPVERLAVRRIRAVLDDDPAQQHSLIELAGIVDMSPHHLAHVFAAEVGAPIFVYAEANRMARARSLLRSKAPLVEIALDLGYSDQSHFTRRFKQHEGLTPGQYRRAAKSLRGLPSLNVDSPVSGYRSPTVARSVVS
jgi:AraC-like DNA-binding protein